MFQVYSLLKVKAVVSEMSLAQDHDNVVIMSCQCNGGKKVPTDNFVSILFIPKS